VVIATILSILVLPFLILTAVGHLLPTFRIATPLRGRISLALVFIFTGLGHFIQTEPMAEMLPPWVPMRKEIIYASGVMELAAAMGLMVPSLSRFTGACLMVFLFLVFPANIYAAVNRVEMGGHAMGPSYLIFRTSLQLILIAWTYWFAVRRIATEPATLSKSVSGGGD
jgi:uncharacterized membrane protein